MTGAADQCLEHTGLAIRWLAKGRTRRGLEARGRGYRVARPVSRASAYGPVLLVQSFGSGTTRLPTECEFRGFTGKRQPEPLHHRLQRSSLEAEPGRRSPGPSD